MRVKAFHIVTESNTVNVLVTLFKQVLPKKIADRIVVHKTLDTLQEALPKEILPSDLGGLESSITKLNGT